MATGQMQSAGTTLEADVLEHALVVPVLVEVTETVVAKSGAAANDPVGLDVLAKQDGAWTK